MAEDDDNLVLRLLRETRSEQSAMRVSLTAIESRTSSIERHMEDVKESVTYALGLAAHANAACDSTGQRLDRQASIETLEKPK
ncbi:hypothetical protein BH23PSE1_BH23PSE1_01790 [soil metagenome]